jgi:hypothetical protein
MWGFFDSLADSLAQNDTYWLSESYQEQAPSGGVAVLRMTIWEFCKRLG